jgi:hypothetical protein
MNVVGSLLVTLCKCWPCRVSSNFEGDITEAENIIISVSAEQLLYMKKKKS